MHRFKIYKIQMCKYAMINKCDRGENCTFAHDISELRIKPDMRKTKLCKSYILGKCTDHNCIYAHSVNELREVGKPAICQLHREGRCIKGNQCRFAHSINDINTKLVQFYEDKMHQEEMGFSHLNSCLDSVCPGESSMPNREGSTGSDVRNGELLHLTRQGKRGEWKLNVNFNNGSSNSSSGSNQHTRENTRNANRTSNTSKGMNRANLIKKSSCNAFLNNNFPNLNSRKEEKKNENILSARNGKYTKLCAINMNMKSTQGRVYRYDEQLLIQDEKEDYLLEGRFKKMNYPQNGEQRDANCSIPSVGKNFTPPFNFRSILSFNGEEAGQNRNTSGAVDYRSGTSGEDSVNYGLTREVDALGEGCTIGLGNQGGSGHGVNFPQGEVFTKVRDSGKKVISSACGIFKEEKTRSQDNDDRGDGLVHSEDRFRVRGRVCWEGKTYPMDMLSRSSGVDSNDNGGRKPLHGGECYVETYPPELQQRGSNDDPTRITPYDRKVVHSVLATNLSNELKKGNGKDKDEERYDVAKYYESALSISRDDMFDFMGGSLLRLAHGSEHVSNGDACNTCKSYLAVDGQEVRGRVDGERRELDGESKTGVIRRMSTQNKALSVRDSGPPNGSIPLKEREEVSEKARLVEGGNEEGYGRDGKKVWEKQEGAAMCAFAVGACLQGDNKRLLHTSELNTERRNIGRGGHSHKGSTACLSEVDNENANGSSNHSGGNQNGVLKEGSAEGLTRYGSGIRGESNSQYGSSSTVDMCAQNLDEFFFGRVEERGVGSGCRKSGGVIRGLMDTVSLGSYEDKKRNVHDGAHNNELLKYFGEMQQWSGCSMLGKLRTEDSNLQKGVSDEHGEGRIDSPTGLGDIEGAANCTNIRPYNLFSPFGRNHRDLGRLPDTCRVKSASHRCVSQDEVIVKRTEKGSSSSDRVGRRHLASTESVANQKRAVEPVRGGQSGGDVPVHSHDSEGSDSGTNGSRYRMNVRGESGGERHLGKNGRNGVQSSNLTDNARVDGDGRCAGSCDGGYSHMSGLVATGQAHSFCNGETKVSRDEGGGKEQEDPAEYDPSGGFVDERLGEKHKVRSLTKLENSRQMREEAELRIASRREKKNNTLHGQVRNASPVMRNYYDGSYDYIIHSNEDDIINNENRLLYRWLGVSSLSESCPMGVGTSNGSPLFTLDDKESYLANLDATGGSESVLWNEEEMSCWSKRSITRGNMVNNGAESRLKSREEEFYHSTLGNIPIGYEEVASKNIFMPNYNWDDKEERLVSTDEGAVGIAKTQEQLMERRAKKHRVVYRRETKFEKGDYYGDLTGRKIFSRGQACDVVEESCRREGEGNLIDGLSGNGPMWKDLKWDGVSLGPLARVHMDDGAADGYSNGLGRSRSKGTMGFLGKEGDKGNGLDREMSHAEKVNQGSHASHALTAAFLNYDYEKGIEDDIVQSFWEERNSPAYNHLDNSFFYDFHVGNGRPFFSHGEDGAVSDRNKKCVYDDVDAAALDDGAFCVNLAKDLDLQFFTHDD
ncbi:hypothetical protein AK88_03857 [Plasmodium fragile]|uniref:C3H1-type domain-containing protein n=1 Tax=Plasmodium fragile TaxID=5857 RepID=A0A0D9QL69_PLAFR|nr:uncharacterized protein AK88_03857 [Plasmodium fragile]KJP86481.1 hypothetical protein AK88_03857 [Plasmodium fragile]